MSSPGSNSPKELQNVSATAFLATLSSGLAVFGLQFALFYFLKIYLPRIYRPRTYLVPEKERVKPPPEGILAWFIPIFKTPNSEFIRKCGLDAYFFLRYLRLLLKIFLPLACIILPILLPVNGTGGNKNRKNSNVQGLNTLAWSNIDPANQNRYWAHLVLAVLLVIYVCYTFFGELKDYIRVRQAYLTSPQHRLRASATTVLVSSIPPKWLSHEALDGLFDVFPGGVRNIWINRNFQALSDKVDDRNKLATKLESAQTSLIKNVKSAQKKKAKKQEDKGKSKKDKKQEAIATDGAAESMAASGDGVESGNPHQANTVREFLEKFEEEQEAQETSSQSKNRLPIVGFEGLGQAVETVGQGLGAMTKLLPGRGNAPRSENGHTKKDVDGSRDNIDGSAEDSNQVQRNDKKLTREGTGDPFTSKDDQEDHPSSQRVDSGHHRFGQLRSGHEFGRQPYSPHTPLSNHLQTPTTAEPGSASLPSPAEQLDQLDVMTQSHWKFWQKNQPYPSPHPHVKEEDEYPLSTLSPLPANANPNAVVNGKGVPAQEQSKQDKSSKASPGHTKQDLDLSKVKYPAAFDPDVANAEEEDPMWKKFIKPKQRDTIRLPLFNLGFMPYMPSWTFIGKKVDKIYYCRKELARLNLEIESDQRHPERFPLMNSAFIQFNHQVAAHMACQSISHHLPRQMTPRLVEISPDDVIWDNMSIRWWEKYIRTGGITVLVVGIVVLWTIPVALSGGLSQLTKLSEKDGFHWIGKLPKSALSLLQGLLPAIILSLLFIIVPFLLRGLHYIQGAQTGNGIQLSVQKSYFAFLFFQLFLVITIASSIASISSLAQNIGNHVTSIPNILASQIPQAANYFFNYMILQALSVSAGAIAQTGTLVTWFLLRPIVDSTPRQKWSRQLSLPEIPWGNFFPVYTNLAVIGLIYSIISPLIMVFNVITFSLFWFVYRYNVLYVNKFRFDTGGLLFPTAVNQLFTGVYVLELALVGLFFLVRDEHGKASAKTQAIIMIVVLIFTVLYQWLLNDAFAPLFRYLPITLEDEAVIRDEEFARIQRQQFQPGNDDELEPESRAGRMQANDSEGHEMQDLGHLSPGSWAHAGARSGSRSRSRSRRSRRSLQPMDSENSEHTLNQDGNAPASRKPSQSKAKEILNPLKANLDPRINKSPGEDTERQDAIKEYDYLFGGANDEIEDLSPDERDALVERAFRHRAMRARRPVIWIPRDDLGVSDDEIRRTHNLTDFVWISNHGTALDSKGRCVFRRAPPDFSDIDLIEL